MSLNDRSLWQNGPVPGSLYDLSVPMKQQGIHRTLNPMVTGTSVLGIKFSDGVVMAADTLGSYGSMAKLWSLPRIMKVNDTTVLSAGGDSADFQFITSIIEQHVIDQNCLADGFVYTPKALFSWLTRVMYNRRSKFNPLWNTTVVGGLQDGKPFLGYVDKLGVAFEAPSIATGYGAYIAQPLLRDGLERNPNMQVNEALELMERCLTVLYYRDARAWDLYDIAVVTKDGVEIQNKKKLTGNWEIAHHIGGYE